MLKKTFITVAHAFVGWVLCAATIGIGMASTSEENALVIHAIAAPLFFGAISLVYFRKFNYIGPLQTAMVFVSFVVFLDLFLVALVILGSFEMFASILGTWIPFALIFVSTYLTGLSAPRYT